jgi:hypothetical protein
MPDDGICVGTEDHDTMSRKKTESTKEEGKMRKVIVILTLVVFGLLGTVLVAKEPEKVKCCIHTKSKKVTCIEMSKADCKSADGKVVKRCEDCK